MRPGYEARGRENTALLVASVDTHMCGTAELACMHEYA